MRLRKLCFKPFTFLKKMRRAWAKFLFSFFSSKLAEMFNRSTAIACNGYALATVRNKHKQLIDSIAQVRC